MEHTKTEPLCLKLMWPSLGLSPPPIAKELPAPHYTADLCYSAFQTQAIDQGKCSELHCHLHEDVPHDSKNLNARLFFNLVSTVVQKTLEIKSGGLLTPWPLLFLSQFLTLFQASFPSPDKLRPVLSNMVSTGLLSFWTKICYKALYEFTGFWRFSI